MQKQVIEKRKDTPTIKNYLSIYGKKQKNSRTPPLKLKSLMPIINPTKMRKRAKKKQKTKKGFETEIEIEI